ncbi:helix-turn-helix domain-containing protein [Streptomyces sp. MI02-7b]|uniref:helix-turn-helix domain-containing protein n=1 Tax=Streptomyces sp. MI02-7b TaxID=462941 RepID=UPI0029BE3493|nr:helix-turn-helix domain-containing protein [Streptomyces sp. MI02-7b]MDX3074060.1 helix-turn-helix domain-containing protein [Streptomyces sp. MI02-7b]
MSAAGAYGGRARGSAISRSAHCSRTQCHMELREGIVIQAFFTDIKPPAERAAYWTDAVGKAFTRLEVRAREDAKIHGAIRQASVAGVHVGSLEASPQRMTRTAPLIAADGDNSLVVSLQRAGAGVATQDGREVPVTAGELVILDTRRPYALNFTGPVRQSVATVPREMLDLPDSALRLATGRTYSTVQGISGVLASYVNGLVTITDHCSCAPDQCACAPASKEFLGRGIVDILTALVALEGNAKDVAAYEVQETLLLRLRTYIRSHLHDPSLSPASVAAAHHISVRYLYQLFQGEPMTVGRWIQRLRLEGCRRDLVTPELAGQTVAAIAHRWGFASHAHFSRTFRSVYGLSPAEFRRAGLSPTGTDPDVGHRA